MTKGPDTRRRRLLLATIIVCYLYPFPYFEELNNPNEHVRLYMTMAIVEEGTFAIDGPTERFGWVNDRARHDGHLYAGKAPGASFLGVPLYAMASWVSELSGSTLSRGAAVRVLRLFAVTIPCIFFLLIFRRFLDDLPGPAWVGDVVLLAYGLGSMAYAYGLMFAGHQLAAVALTGALIAFYGVARQLEKNGEGLSWRAALGGGLLGAAPALEYPAAIGSLFVGIYALVLLRRRPLLLCTAFAMALIPAAMVLGFHQAAFGSPLAFPYDFIETPAFQRWLGEGWHGATYPRPDRLVTILFAPSFGLFFFTPLLFLAPYGWFELAKSWRVLPTYQRHLAWLLPGASLTLILYLASSALWRAGWAVGPRYIATAVPFLALSSLFGLSALMRRYPRAATISAALLAVLSVVHAGTSGALYPHQPESFDNPVYDLNLRLVELGFAPHHALEFLGLFGYWALVPLGFAAFVAVTVVALGPPRSSPWSMVAHGVCVLALAGICAALLARVGEDTPAEDRLWSLVVRKWEPKGHSAPEGRVRAFEELAAPTPEQQRAAAEDYALLGNNPRAAGLRRTAERRAREQRERDLQEDTLMPSLQLNPGWGAGDP